MFAREQLRRSESFRHIGKAPLSLSKLSDGGVRAMEHGLRAWQSPQVSGMLPNHDARNGAGWFGDLFSASSRVVLTSPQ